MVAIAGTEPKVELVEVDVEEIYKAIEKNGWEHLRGSWLGGVGKKAEGACVLGQALLNLNVAGNFGTVSRFLPRDSDIPNEYMEGLYAYSLEKQLNTLICEHPRWTKISDNFGPYSCANIIVYWNDLMDDMGTDFVLKTYKEVVQMCYDVLSPHFGTKLTLMKFDYGL